MSEREKFLLAKISEFETLSYKKPTPSITRYLKIYQNELELLRGQK